MNKEEILIDLHEIKRIKTAADAIIVYTKSKVWVCEKNSEQFISDYIVEYNLKTKRLK